jgi:general L-amino acid transport system substrate-binding protein
MTQRIIVLILGILFGAGGLYFFLPYEVPVEKSESGPKAATTATPTASAKSTLRAVRERGYLHCGVSQGLPGFSNPDDKGNWTGIDVDFCRAVAAAIFGDAAKVRYRPLSAKDRFTALQSGEVDLLSRNTTWTLTRDTALGLDFAGTIYYDGQGFMVKKASNITSAVQLNGATICTQTGTTTELNLADYFRSQNIPYKVLSYEKNEEGTAAFDDGRCDAFTTDASGLHAFRLQLKKPDENLILPEVISKEPLGPLVRQGDPQWADIVRWTLFVLINAEDLGLNAMNVEQMKAGDNPEVRRMLGTESDFGKTLGLENDWAVNIVSAVGNYGDIYERNVGLKTPLGIPRGLNALWRNGGLIYAPPIR